ncbi:MAG: hypothetical protein M3N50_09820 [Pseudomonadota bacterium]|nr:hypothetical protein [Pseudomonadota bacterium]
MASDSKTRNDSESTFSFGVRELREAKLNQALALNIAPQKAANDKQGLRSLQHVRQLRSKEKLDARR